MLHQVERAESRWGGSHDVIDSWLNERKELLIQYCQLAGLPPFSRAAGALPDKESVLAFCEILMDYVSAGHFEVYEKLTGEEAKRDDTHHYASISQTTDVALDFNDRFATESDHVGEGFDSALSALGQALEERFELEDDLINAIYDNADT
ncbi:Rsd/AlgQ family anti-sigma factor [Aestuariibacter salexigens]|uniref:Rsd/AlgQ family anti-sigma factor n=1 Tax=Aestuariibacter salexigens TaxID=226010 RepID=UPI00040A90C2|nr:Rsd/AlgQ family anti-sigma factor [Aestuariibacter salexigens]